MDSNRKPWERAKLGIASYSCTIDYTPDQIEFMLAMDRWKRENSRHPTCRDVLAVAIALGYRKLPRGKKDE